MKLVGLVLLSLCFIGCSTHQKSRLAATGIGIGVGAVVGSATAPSDERPELHAMYWGGIVGVITAVAANYYFDDEKELNQAKTDLQDLRNLIEANSDRTAIPGKQIIKVDAETAKYFPGGKAAQSIKKVEKWEKVSPFKRRYIQYEVELEPVGN